MITKDHLDTELNVHPFIRVCKFAPYYFYNLS